MVPKNMVEEWKVALKCEKLSAGKSVCERHFLPDQIEWKVRDSVVKNGQVLGTVCSHIYLYSYFAVLYLKNSGFFLF